MILTEAQKHKLELAKIPRRFVESDLSNWIPDGQQMFHVKQKATTVCDKFPQLLKDGFGGMIFYGNVGTGKTHLGIGIIKELISRYNAFCRYVNVFDFISSIRSTWNNPMKHEQEVMDLFASYHLLVIDEIGVQHGSRSEQVSLFQLINQRSLNKLPTILISNLDETDLKICIGERSVDRIFENNGGTLSFTWNSYRRKPKQPKERRYE